MGKIPQCLGILLVFSWIAVSHAQPISLTIHGPEAALSDTLNKTLRYFLDAVKEDPELRGLVKLETVDVESNEVLWVLNDGGLDFAMVSTQDIEVNRADLGLRPQPIALFNQPLVFANLQETVLVEESWLGSATLNALAQNGSMLGLAFWNSGMTQFVGNESLINIEDYKDREIMTSGLRPEVLAGVGTKPLFTPLSEVVPRLSRFTDSAAELPEEMVPSLAESITSVTALNYRPVVHVLVANRNSWHSLPEEVQIRMAQVARATGRYSTDISVATAEELRREFSSLYASPDPKTRQVLRQTSLENWHKQQPEEITGYLDDALSLIGGARIGLQEARIGDADKPTSVRILFATDRNDESSNNPKVDPEYRMGSKRDPTSRYCGIAPITVNPHRPYANEDEEYFTLNKFDLVPWGSDGDPCRTLIAEKLDEAADTKMLLFVHGYNNTFFDALRRAASIAIDTEFPGILVVWSWPTHGALLDYAYDEESVTFTRWHFDEFVELLYDLDNLDEVVFMTHSMGTRVVLDVLQNMARRQYPLRLDEVIFAAPDVAIDNFLLQYSDSATLAERRTLYANSKDCPLRLSRRIHNAPRAGLGGKHLIVIPKLDSIDATTLFSRWVPCPTGSWSKRHGYVFNHKKGVTDLRKLIVDRLTPPHRGLPKKRKNNLPYWILKD